jgi:two-component system OmpR family sensor kinase
MGRLFWKCFLASWLTLILAGFVTFTGVRLYRLAENGNTPFPADPRARFELSSASAVLRHAGPAALAAALEETGSPMIVIDPAGNELRGQDVSDTGEGAGKETVSTPEGVFTLFIPAGHVPPPPDGMLGPPPGPPAPWEPMAVAVLSSAVIAALLAWYLSRPVKTLLAAFRNMAEGRLDTRVGELMRRRDEFSELGRDFDRMAEKLQNLILSQRRLLHDVSHELRSPLGRLHVAMGIIRQAPDRAETALVRMERDMERLDGLIDEILTLSRLNSGVESEPEEMVEISQLVEDVVRDARFEALEKGCHVRLRERAQPIVAGRPRLIARAVENILRNGLKFSPPKAALDVEIDIDGPFAVIRITDTGPGIPGDELASIFEPFHRGRQNAGTAGFGLGLAIARAAVELHGGTLAARNGSCGGLCMEMRLPTGPTHAPGPSLPV